MFWIISWFAAGFIAAMSVCISDMRGQPFDENYFDNGIWFVFLLIIVIGYISFIIALMVFMNEKRLLAKLIYRIANIGTKKNDFVR